MEHIRFERTPEEKVRDEILNVCKQKHLALLEEGKSPDVVIGFFKQEMSGNPAISGYLGSLLTSMRIPESGNTKEVAEKYINSFSFAFSKE